MKPGQPSQTALVIPKGLVYLSLASPLPCLVPEEDVAAYRDLVEAAGAGGQIRRLRHGWYRRWVACLERATVPGIFRHFALRKQCIRSLVEAAVNDTEQVVVLGAGMDLLASRIKLARPALRVYEIDLEGTQQIKRAAGFGAGVVLVAADLAREALSEVLQRAPAFDPAAPTVFVLEGVSMYLEAAEIRSLLHELAAGPRQLVMTFMARHRGGIHFANATRLLRLWLAVKGEPFRWGIEADGLADFLAEQGWRLERVVDTESMRRAAGLGSEPIAQGEHIALARVGEAR